MDRLAYLAAMALLGIGLTMAQSKPSSDPSNSSNPTQTQSDTGTPSGRTSHGRHKGDRSGTLPSPVVTDQQNSTTNTTGASGQNPQPSNSTMGTTGSTPGTPDQRQQENPAATVPQTAPPADQQPNLSSSPNASPHAEILQTPATRAAATHTPDPGTCMNPAALEGGQGNNQSRPCN